MLAVHDGRLLVGRDAELATLSALLIDAGAHRGRAVLLLGEAGIGKTRLAEAVADAAGAAGFAVTWGRCPDGEAPPYWPWSQALGGLLGDTAKGLFEEHRPRARADLFASVVDALETVTTTTAAAIILEDVHWTDASSLALLQFVAGVVPGLAMLLVVTARDDPLDQGDAVAAALAGLPPAVLRLALLGLDRQATGALVEQVAGRGTSDRTVADLHQRTGGNPFFVTEIVRLQAMRGDPGVAPADLPAGVHQVLSRRLARLPQAAAELLWAAAVIGEPDVDLLAAVTDQAEDCVLALLDEAVGGRLVTSTEGGFRFTHALVRESLYADLSPTVRSRLHRRAAGALERAGGNPGDLATHWARAGGAEARRRSAASALQAADGAMARMGYEQAARYYRWAADGGAGDPLTVARCLGEAEVLAGRLNAGRDTLRRAAEAALRAGRADEAARSVLAMGTGGFEIDVTDLTQARLLDEALRALPADDSALRAAVLARLSLVRTTIASPQERAAMARAAVEMARRVGDPAAEAAALAAASDALAGPDHVAERLAAAGRMLEVAEATGDTPLVLLARRLRLVARLEQGDRAGVDADIAAYARAAEHLRLALYAWLVPVWRGMRALMDGDLDGARRGAETAEALGRHAGSANAEMMVWSLRLAIARTEGTVDQFVPMAETMLSGADAYPAWHCCFAAVFAQAGLLDRARPHFDRALADGIEAIPKDSEWIELLWQLSDAAVLLDAPGPARAVHEALTPYAHLQAVDGIGGACYGPVSDQLDRLAAYLAIPHPARPSPPPAAGEEGEFRREGKLWHLSFRGQAATVADSKGMADLAALLARPGREVHVLDLVEAAGGPSPEAAGAATGPALDARARAAYRARLVELEEEIAAAEAVSDDGRAERLRAERDFVAAELAGALGLGGRPRQSGDQVERARKAVTMRISTAFKAIDAVHPALGRHLRLTVATGRFCSYQPERPATWTT